MRTEEMTQSSALAFSFLFLISFSSSLHFQVSLIVQSSIFKAQSILVSRQIYFLSSNEYIVARLCLHFMEYFAGR
jgi:hypothetical protein